MNKVQSALQTWLPLTLIVLIGAGLRFYRIGQLPPGLYRDEAFYGLDALRVLSGDLSVYFVANNGREGLFMYLLAAGIALFGRTPEALRIVSACIGTTTIVAIYFAARNMFSHRVGILSAAILAITFWHVALSRVAYRAITLPLALCVLMALIFAALRTNTLSKRLLFAACAGAAFGATFYTYTSAQMTLPLVALFALSLAIGLQRGLFTHRNEEAVYRRRMSAVVFGVAALVVLAPLLMWLARHGEVFFNRAEQVSILSPAINNGDFVGTLFGNIIKAVGMFAFQGDRIWRHNLSLRPVFDGFLAVAFFVGVGVCAWRWLRSWQSRYGSDILGVDSNVAPQFALLWLAVFLLPTILAEDTPHFLRAIGALPAACILAAVGLEAVLALASRRGIISGLTMFLRRVISPPAFVAVVVLALSAINTITDYFNDYVNRPLTAYWLEAQNTALASAISNSNLPPTNVWLEDRLANDNPALAFLLKDSLFTLVRNEGGEAVVYDAHDIRVPLAQWPTASADIVLIVDPNYDWTALRNALPPGSTWSVSEGPLAQADREQTPRRAFVAIRAARVSSAGTPHRFEQDITLEDAEVTPLGDNLFRITLRWAAAQPIPDDMAVFVHWMRGDTLAAQTDATPALGYLPMPTWRPGNPVDDVRVLGVPGGSQPGDQIAVGIYRRGNSVRLKVLDQQGRPMGDSVMISVP